MTPVRSQDDMIKSTSDYEFWKMNPGSGRRRGEEKEKKRRGRGQR